MLTQQELERRMLLAGRNRVEAAVGVGESTGRAHRNPYARPVHRTFTVPLIALLKEHFANPKPLKAGHGLRLLRTLNPEAVAFLAVRTCLNAVLEGMGRNHRRVAYLIGKAVHNEMVLAQIAEELPDLHYTLARDFQRRMSEDEDHRMTVFKMKAREAGASWVEWDRGSRDVTGLYLLGRLFDVGLVDITAQMTDSLPGSFRRSYREVHLTPAAKGLLDSTVEYLAETRPDFGPCVEQPLDWPSVTGGGFHTPEMRKAHRYLVKAAASARPLYRNHKMPGVLAAVNHLQATAWRVNVRVLNAVLAMARTPAGVPGAYVPATHEKPARPDFLDRDRETYTLEENDALRAWKEASRRYYEAERLGAQEFGTFYRATRQAAQFREYPRLYFVHFLDSRGRDYCLSNGLTPQGSDLQKALLEFADPKPVGEEGAKWFLLQGANTGGHDKAPLDERLAWARSFLPQAKLVAQDPIAHRDLWAHADEPLQFLAWCFEAAEWDENPEYLSRLRVGLDGSCNGLQHFSAMLRDPVGGESVNLIPQDRPADVYRKSADRAYAMMAHQAPCEERDWWLKNGVERAAMKRVVMTLPYGVTYDGAARHVAGDYLSGALPDSTPGTRMKYARALIAVGWEALKHELPSAMSVRTWLSKLGIQAAKAGSKPLTWVTPSGFLASQAYYKAGSIKVHTYLHGPTYINVAFETDKMDATKHGTALAPNFVHSLDAAHLHRVVQAAKAAGITHLGMVHDSFSTHAADTGKLYQIIREEFVKMYQEHDVLEELKVQLGGTVTTPSKGNLDISLVRESTYAFL